MFVLGRQLTRLGLNPRLLNSSIESSIKQHTITRVMSSSPTYSADYLKDKLEKALDAPVVQIEDLSNCGCGMKFDALIVSPKFEGKKLLQRQRLVNEVLVEEMKYIHAFTMKTITPDELKK